MPTISELMSADRGFKGRSTIRRGATGPSAVRIPLWQWSFAPKSVGARLEQSYVNDLATIDAFEDKFNEGRKGGRFTDAGLLQEMGHHALSVAMPALHRSREAIRKATTEVKAIRATITLPPVDKADAVGYLRRLEIRGHLAAMPEEKRRHYISQNRETLDPEFVQAIIEMSPVMSGVLDGDHAYFKDRELRRIHGSAVDDLQKLELALETAKGVSELSRKEICRDLGVVPGRAPTGNGHGLPKPRETSRAFDPIEGTALYESTFDEMAEIYETPHDAPWIKRFSENGTNVIRVFKPGVGSGAGTWALASDDDADSGIFYKDFDAYERREAA